MIFIVEDMAVPKKNSIPAVYVLPSDNTDLQSFSKKFKLDMMEQVVSIIEFALTNELPLIEVFQFKNSDFVITLSEKDYLTNLDNIYSYYLNNEIYEHCTRVARLQKLLKERFVNTTNENQTNK